MNFNINIIRFFKTARDSPAGDKFLRTLREKLVEYMKVNPPLAVASAEKTKVGVFNFLQFRALPLAIAGGLIIFGLGTTLVYSQDSMPGNMLYPVKLLSEKIRSAAAINPRTSADLHINFAQKRMIEMEKVLGDAYREDRAKNIEGILDNFAQQIDKTYKKAQKLKEEGELEDAWETTNDLKAALEISQSRLEEGMGKIKEDKEMAIFEKTISSVGDWKQGLKDDIESLNANEDERAKKMGFEQSAKGKMEAAKNKIDEVKDFINKRNEKSGAEGAAKDAENKLDEAQNLFAEVKSLYVAQKYEEAFEKAKNAFQTASDAKTLVRIFPERQRGKDDEKSGGEKSEALKNEDTDNNHEDDEKDKNFEQKGEDNDRD